MNSLSVSSISASFDTNATGELDGWKFRYTINEFMSSKDILLNLAKSCKSIIRWDSNNEPSLITLGKSSYTTARTIKGTEITVSGVYESSLDDICNKLTLKYNKGENYRTTIIREDDRTNIGSQDVYNIVSNTTIETDFISDSTTAGLLANFYCKDDDDSFWSKLHNILEFEAPLLGHNYWNGSTFVPFMALEIGDVVEFEDMIVDCNGETWTDKQFMIISIQIGNKIRITGFEV